MPKLPVLTGNKVISLLEKVCFYVTRQKGSHVRMEQEDGRVLTIPVHAGKNIGRGLVDVTQHNIRPLMLLICVAHYGLFGERCRDCGHGLELGRYGDFSDMTEERY